MSENDRLREDRLAFYKEDIELMDKVLIRLIELSKAKSVLLIDNEGHMVTTQGDTKDIDVESISALIAASFAATKQMAKLLGEDEFSVLFHQGKRDSIHLQLIGERTLLTIIFNSNTTVGLVRLYAKEASERLEDIFVSASKRTSTPKEALGHDFGKSAKDTLDNIFG